MGLNQLRMIGTKGFVYYNQDSYYSWKQGQKLGQIWGGVIFNDVIFPLFEKKDHCPPKY